MASGRRPKRRTASLRFVCIDDESCILVVVCIAAHRAVELERSDIRCTPGRQPGVLNDMAVIGRAMRSISRRRCIVALWFLFFVALSNLASFVGVAFRWPVAFIQT
jgi:hypothetical protein